MGEKFVQNRKGGVSRESGGRKSWGYTAGGTERRCARPEKSKPQGGGHQNDDLNTPYIMSRAVFKRGACTACSWTQAVGAGIVDTLERRSALNLRVFREMSKPKDRRTVVTIENPRKEIEIDQGLDGSWR